jgi:hypothetical protein
MTTRSVVRYMLVAVLFAAALIAARLISGRPERAAEARRAGEVTQRCVDKVETQHSVAHAKNDTVALHTLSETFGLSADVATPRWSDLLPAVVAFCSRQVK